MSLLLANHSLMSRIRRPQFQQSPITEEYTTFLNYVQSQGITPPTSVEDFAYNEMIARIKTAPALWDKIIGLWRHDAPSKALAKINIVNPGTHNLVEAGGSMTFSGKSIGSRSPISGVYYNPSILSDQVAGIAGETYGTGLNNSCPGGAKHDSVNHTALLIDDSVAGGIRGQLVTAMPAKTWTNQSSYTNGAWNSSPYGVVYRDGQIHCYYHWKRRVSVTRSLGTQSKELDVLGLFYSNHIGTTTEVAYTCFFSTAPTDEEYEVFAQAMEIFRSAIQATDFVPEVIGPNILFPKSTPVGTVDVYLMLGQSNMAGMAPVPDKYKKPLFNANFMLAGRPNFRALWYATHNVAGDQTTIGMEQRFMRLALQSNKTGNPIYCLKAAWGNTSIDPSPSSPFSFHPSASPNTRYKLLRDNITVFMLGLSRLIPYEQMNIRTLWVQGEAEGPTQQARYDQDFRELFDTLVAEISADLGISFSFGEIWAAKDRTIPAGVSDKLDQLVTEGYITGTVSLDNCEQNPEDMSHYSVAGYDQMADNFYNAMF